MKKRGGRGPVGTEKSGFEKPLFSVPTGSFKTKYLY